MLGGKKDRLQVPERTVVGIEESWLFLQVLPQKELWQQEVSTHCDNFLVL